MKTVGIVGCGNMGSAVAAALSNDKDWNVLLYDIRQEYAKDIATSLGASYYPLTELLKQSEIVVLAVKPQVIGSLYKELYPYSSTCSWISLMAGVTLDTLEKRLRSNQIVRIQPNIAARVGKAVTAVAAHERAENSFVETTCAIVRKLGSAYQIPESLIPAFTGVSGSGIAACLSFLHGIAMGGVAQGLSYPMALSLIRDTAESASAIVRESQKHPVDLLTTVCSPGGTTIEMMQVLEQGAFQGILMDAVRATADKVRLLDELSASQDAKD